MAVGVPPPVLYCWEAPEHVQGTPKRILSAKVMWKKESFEFRLGLKTRVL